ncbi:MAG: 30S ribosomal protein S17 [Alphaproteobacteria bacterium]
MPRAVLQGVVTSDKRDKTVRVRVQRRVKHPLYGKIVRVFKNYAAHDPSNAYKLGDVVSIRESRPYSKTKCWEVFSCVAQGMNREGV